MTFSKCIPVLLAGVTFCSSSLKADPTPPNPASLAPSGTQMVVVADPNNSPDDGGQGKVDHVFMMGAYEWTVGDWFKMLQDIAALPDFRWHLADRHGLWNSGMSPWITRTGNPRQGYTYTLVPGTENYPITCVSLHDIHRACNYWQNKGALPLGDLVSFDTITEDGAYTITSNPDGSETDTLSPTAQFYIPTRGEWHKAAYFGKVNGNPYWHLYATQQENNPGASNGSVFNNRANYDLSMGYAPVALCDVNQCGGLDLNGVPIGTYSYYGCFDMNGNVNEWTDSAVGKENIILGGCYADFYYMFERNYLERTVTPRTVSPETKSDKVGFRMAAVAPQDATTTGYSEDPSQGWSSLTTGEQLEISTAAAAAAIGALATGYWIWAPAAEGAVDITSVEAEEDTVIINSGDASSKPTTPSIREVPAAGGGQGTGVRAIETSGSETPGSAPNSARSEGSESSFLGNLKQKAVGLGQSVKNILSPARGEDTSTPVETPRGEPKTGVGSPEQKEYSL